MEIFTLAETENMRLALCEAREAALENEVPAGAVIVDAQGDLVSTGRNGVINRSDPTAHAEILAIRAAAQKLGNYRLPGLTLYSTLEPCPMCLAAAIHARLQRVIYGAPEPRWGAAGSLLSLHESSGLNHRLEVRGGLLAGEAQEQIRTFFQARRKNTV